MVRCASLFSQLIGVFNRNDSYSLVIKHKAERYAKGFNSWEHFIAMLFCQIVQAKSLWEIYGELSCCMGKLGHLGMNGARKNQHCPMRILKDLVKCTVTCLISPLKSAKNQHPQNTNSDSKTDFSHLIVPPWPFVCLCFYVPSSEGPKWR